MNFFSSKEKTEEEANNKAAFALDQDFDERLASFKSDCSNGSLISCHSLAEFTSVVLEDFVNSSRLFKKGCYAEEFAEVMQRANKSLGQGAVRGKSPKDNKDAILYPPSCFNLGRQALSGIGMEKDEEGAFDAFSRGCTLGEHLPSCHHLAIMLADASAIVKNADIAKTDASAAPEEPEPAAPVVAVQKPVTLQKSDLLKATNLFAKSCLDGGDQASCYLLGGLLLSGRTFTDKSTTPPTKTEILKPSPKSALQYFENGCKSGHAPSCFNLAVMYKKGEVGVAVDEKKFEMYKEITNKLVQQNGGGLQGVSK